MRKTLSFLYLVCAVLFLVVGLAMIIFDQWYMRGAQYIVSSLALFAATPRVNKYLGSWAFKDPVDAPAMNLGFILLCVGISVDIIGMWALGFILFLTGFSWRNLITTD